MQTKNQSVAAELPTLSHVLFNVFFYTVLGLAFMYAIGAFAQDITPVLPANPVVAPPPGLEWLGALLQWVTTIPKVGPIVVNILKYVGAAAAIFTALSVAVTSVLKVPALVARWSGASILATKIELFSDSLKPYLNYFSIFNA